MTKVTGEIDTRNPFIPAQSKLCRAAETYFVVLVLAASTLACVATLYRLFVR